MSSIDLYSLSIYLACGRMCVPSIYVCVLGALVSGRPVCEPKKLKKFCAFTNSVTIIQCSKNHFTDSGTISQNASPYIGKHYISQLQRNEQGKSHNFCILCDYSSTVTFWNTVFFK
jgi:hypothetical protein